MLLGDTFSYFMAKLLRIAMIRVFNDDLKLH